MEYIVNKGCFFWLTVHWWHWACLCLHRGHLQQEFLLAVLSLEFNFEAGGGHFSGILFILRAVLYHFTVLRLRWHIGLACLLHLHRTNQVRSLFAQRGPRSNYFMRVSLFWIWINQNRTEQNRCWPLPGLPLADDWALCNQEAPPNRPVCRCGWTGERSHCCYCLGAERKRRRRTGLGSGSQGCCMAYCPPSWHISSCWGPAFHSRPLLYPLPEGIGEDSARLHCHDIVIFPNWQLPGPFAVIMDPIQLRSAKVLPLRTHLSKQKMNAGSIFGWECNWILGGSGSSQRNLRAVGETGQLPEYTRADYCSALSQPHH